MSNMWAFRDASWLAGRDVTGYDVEAADGAIGKVDEATNEADAGHLVVDTGFWIFGKLRLIPAGTVTGIDHDAKVVRVAMTKDDIKSAPDFEESVWDDEARVRYSDYYGPYSW